MSRECLSAASPLRDVGYWRACVNRCYYAAYCAVAARVAGRVTFRDGKGNPGHGDLFAYVMHNIAGLTTVARHSVRKALSALQKDRISADYRPQACIGSADARAALRNTGIALDGLGMRWT